MTKNIIFVSTLIAIGAAIALTYTFSKAPLEQVADVSQCSTESDMVLVKGGSFNMGAGAVYPEEKPMVKRQVNDFLLSSTEVTNAQFAEFVNATSYVTLAERVPDPKLYPNIPSELLVPGSAVFVKLKEAVNAGTFLNWWHFVEGANWRNPNGPDSDIADKEHYPVVHIAFEDALAYANWKGHRLPTEEEFEYASRNGLKDSKYAWGDTFADSGKHQANTWQGLFPFQDDGDDGFVGLAPVGCYKSNRYGVHDLIGNVWEWTQSTYYPRHFEEKTPDSSYPEQGYDPNQPDVAVGVIKGGSYLCAPDFCMRYRPAARQAQDTGLGTTHIGFRTAKSI